jgi:hypothetical protein
MAYSLTPTIRFLFGRRGSKVRKLINERPFALRPWLHPSLTRPTIKEAEQQVPAEGKRGFVIAGQKMHCTASPACTVQRATKLLWVRELSPCWSSVVL